MNNVKYPAEFLAKFTALNEAFYVLFELTREEPLEAVSEDGCIRYFEESGKCCFQVAGQYTRPDEFLDALLDIIRATYEPSPPGTLFLNSNPGFIYEAIPKVPFTLGYLSVVGAPEQSFTSIWQDITDHKIPECGYDLRSATAVFIVVAGSNRLLEVINEVHEATGSGFSVDEVCSLYANALGHRHPKVQKEVYAGYVWDKGLDERLRVSMWMIMEGQQDSV